MSIAETLAAMAGLTQVVHQLARRPSFAGARPCNHQAPALYGRPDLRRRHIAKPPAARANTLIISCLYTI